MRMKDIVVLTGKKTVLAVFMTAGIFLSCVGCAGQQSENNTTKSSVNKDIETEEQTTGKDETAQETALSYMQQINSFTQKDSVQISKNENQIRGRTFYEIFVYSYSDSNGDGIGDFKGAQEKLDELNDGDQTTDEDLSINGIWLMPIMPSESYHKYDVADYCSIDPQYGTMQDFESFLAACKRRDIKVIIDLPVNHTSSKHPWFLEACKYLKTLKDGEEPDVSVCPYVSYYHFSKEKKEKYVQVPDSQWYYEAQFSDSMPDLNLETDAVYEELEKIVTFWTDKGVDGFRLDAVKEFETGNDTKSIAMLKRFVDLSKAIKPDIYLVAEVWNNMEVYTTYYESGINSCFDFAFANQDGIIANTIKNAKGYNALSYGKAVTKIQNMIEEKNEEAVDAPFYTNHDMGRSAGYYSGDNSEAQTKMAQAMNLLMSGNAFIYYGEEIGMKGSGKDENKRAPMYFTKDSNAEFMCDGPADIQNFKMKYAPLDEQKLDGNSIYQFVKETIKLRNHFAPIANGKSEVMEAVSNQQIVTIRKEYDGKELLLVYNISDQVQTMDYADVTVNEKVPDSESLAGVLLTAAEPAVMKESTLSMPAYSVAVIQ